MYASRWIRFVPAVALMALTLVACSKSAQTYLERGNAQLEKGNVDAAVLEYRNAVGKDAMFAPARLKLAEAYLRQGNGAGALAESVRAADLLPKDADAQLKVGSLLLMAGRAEDAKSRADKALAINPKNVGVLVLRANAMAGLKDLDGAMKDMQQALSLYPRSSYQSNLGAIQAACGNLAEAEAAFRQAVTTDPKSVPAQLALGQFLWAAGKPADAEAAFRTALSLQPANHSASSALATFYLRTDRAAEAEPYLKKTVEASGAVDAKLALADYYVGMKRPADAVAVLEKLGAEPRYWALARTKVAGIQHMLCPGERLPGRRLIAGVQLTCERQASGDRSHASYSLVAITISRTTSRNVCAPSRSTSQNATIDEDRNRRRLTVRPVRVTD